MNSNNGNTNKKDDNNINEDDDGVNMTIKIDDGERIIGFDNDCDCADSSSSRSSSAGNDSDSDNDGDSDTDTSISCSYSSGDTSYTATYDDDDDKIESSSSSSCSCSSTSTSSSNTVYDDKGTTTNNCPIITATKQWVERVPIGMKFCPWAIQAARRNRIKYVVVEEASFLDGDRRRHCLRRSSNTTTTTFNENDNGNDTDNIIYESVLHEIRKLIMLQQNLKSTTTTTTRRKEKLLLNTTLIVCPNVIEWKHDFDSFDQYVKNFWMMKQPQNDNNDSKHEKQEEIILNNDDLNECVTLVGFHPQFCRWKSLPSCIGVGSTVRCHYGIHGFTKSVEPSSIYVAQILETCTPMFGHRKVKVRFLSSATSSAWNNNNNDDNHHHTTDRTNEEYKQGDDDNADNKLKQEVSCRQQKKCYEKYNKENDTKDEDENNKDTIIDGTERQQTSIMRMERYIPVDWIVFDDDENRINDGDEKDRDNDSNNKSTTTAINKNNVNSFNNVTHQCRHRRQPLLDNCMHQSPYPMIHIIHNDDLVKLRVRDVSRIKRKNIETIRTMMQ